MKRGIGWAICIATMLWGCTDDPEACGVQGGTQACTCNDGREGAQVCLPEGVWDECECTGALEGGVAPGDGGSGGSGGGGAGTGGSPDTGGSGGADGTGGTAAPDEDGGTDPTPTDAGPGVDSGAGGSGGGGGSGGAGGTGGATSPADDYATCQSDADCGGASCRETADPDIFNLGGTIGVCAADCQADGDCPMPGGAYDATPVCDGGSCRLDCAPVFPLPFARSCPGGMVCAGEGLSQSCYPTG